MSPRRKETWVEIINKQRITKWKTIKNRNVKKDERINGKRSWFSLKKSIRIRRRK